jgi:hypothetical protein
VVRRHVGVHADPVIMPNQLRHIVDTVGASSLVEVRVIPFSAGAHLGLYGPFSLLEFKAGPADVLYLEGGRTPSVLITGDSDRVAEYQGAFEELLYTALPVDQSLEFIEHIAEDLMACIIRSGKPQQPHRQRERAADPIAALLTRFERPDLVRPYGWHRPDRQQSMEGRWMAARSYFFPALGWRKSSHSLSNDECVEVARVGPVVLVRDSRDESCIVLEFTPSEWRAFLARTRGTGSAAPNSRT